MDEAAFDRLFQEHHRMVTAWIYSFVRDQDVALDLCQEVFLAVHAQREQLPDVRSFPAWLRGIGRNLAWKHLRKQSVLRLLLVDDSKAEDLFQRFDPPPADSPSPWEDRLAALEGCVQRLPAQQRAVVDQVYREAKPARAVAEVLGIAEKTVFQMAWIARKNLRRCIELRLAQEGLGEGEPAHG